MLRRDGHFFAFSPRSRLGLGQPRGLCIVIVGFREIATLIEGARHEARPSTRARARLELR